MPDRSEERWRSFSQHLGQALELPDSERGPWLQALAASDPELAADIERKLRARDRHGFKQFLSESLFPPGDAARSLLGQMVGPYRIEADIGRGAAGSVWRARAMKADTAGLVAIRFVDAYALGRTGEGHFRGKDRSVPRVDHPNIAGVIDVGLFNDSQPYLVTRYVEGESIDAYCERRSLGIRDRVMLFRTVLAAVGYAHSLLLIHRDLKPSNILVTHDGVVKVLEYGLATLLREYPAAAATQTYALTQSPRYAAPEQLLGQPLSAATDVYALALVLYVLLTGQHPIAAQHRSSADLIQAVLHELPARASLVTDQASRRRALRGDLDSILGRALAKDPAQRYPSVQALADDLARHLADEPVQAGAGGLVYRARKFVRRYRRRVIGYPSARG
jgi:eukaryotic-like serine/threonine-protein kinase